MLFGLTACAGASMVLSPIANNISPQTTYSLQLGGENNNVIQVNLTISLCVMSNFNDWIHRNFVVP